MPFYADSQSFYNVMIDLFGQVMEDPALLKPIRDGRILLRIVTTVPDAVLVLDGRFDPTRFTAGRMISENVDLGLRTPADVLHRAWLGQERLRDAFLAGRIKLDTSPLRALTLLSSLSGLFRHLEGLYPQVLRDHELL
jgi:hypothetical protein